MILVMMGMMVAMVFLLSIVLLMLRKNRNNRFDLYLLLSSLCALLLEVWVLVAYFGDHLGSYGQWGTILWLAAVISGLAVYIFGWIKAKIHFVNLLLYSVPGLIGLGLLGLYMLANFITSM